MVKKKSTFECQGCGFVSPQWLGKCPQCQSWEGFLEVEKFEIKNSKNRQREGEAAALPLTDIEPIQRQPRDVVGLPEIDRCLGGGWTHGSLILMGGDPGIGKSTVTLQLILSLLKKNPLEKALYVSGEESVHQINQRVERVLAKEASQVKETFYLLAETCLEKIEKIIKHEKPKWIVIDSIQTTFSSEVESGSGTLNQMREVALRAMKWAKDWGHSVLLIGHVTKDGAIAGPKLLEHMVDTVLQFEGDRGTGLRLLRTLKNRFGPTFEVGVFEMMASGLKEVLDPAQIYRTQRSVNAKISGSSLCCIFEGTRPFVTEVQALVGVSGYGMGKRLSSGIEAQRTSLVAAVLEKYLNLKLMDRDLYVSSIGGIRISDPAADLAVLSAILSSAKNRAIPQDMAFIGEVTLTGEVRGVSNMPRRIQELKRLGCNQIISGPCPEFEIREGKAHSNVYVIRSVKDLSFNLWGEGDGGDFGSI